MVDDLAVEIDKIHKYQVAYRRFNGGVQRAGLLRYMTQGSSVSISSFGRLVVNGMTEG